MNILNMVILFATLISTGALAESNNAEHKKTKLGRRPSRPPIVLRKRHTRQKTGWRRHNFNLKTGEKLSATVKVKENKQIAWNRSKENTDKG